MKRFHASLATVVAVAGLLWLDRPAESQAPASREREVPHKIGLIDMGYVFKNYKKAQVLHEDLKREVEAADADAKKYATQIQNLQKELQGFKPDSPEFLQKEKELHGLSSQFDVFRSRLQRELMRKESELYKTIFLEVSDTVAKYAEAFDYTLILRFDRESLDTAEDAQTIIQRLNREVIYHRKGDDVTESVVDYLNRKYEATAGGARPPASGVRPAGASDIRRD